MVTRVKELREQRKMSQLALGTRIGCSQNTISKIEKGECDPKASILIEMAKYFGVSIDYILCISDYKNYTELQVRYGSQPDLMKEYMDCMNRVSHKSKILVKDIAERLAAIENEKKNDKL